MNSLSRINLKHLRYFAEVARRGSVNAAASALHVTPQTVSAQVLTLEDALGQPLFERAGKRLVLTREGKVAQEYANAIFTLGDELRIALTGATAGRRELLRIGITDSVPKLLAIAVIEPVWARHQQQLELHCSEGGFNHLLGQLVVHELDGVLGEYPVPPHLARTLQGTLISSSGTSFLAAPRLARRISKAFPENLHDAPMLYGAGDASTAAQALNVWFAQQGVQPRIVGRFDDSALMKGFAQCGLGIVSCPSSVESEIMRQYGLKLLGRAAEVVQPLFLIRMRRGKPHPVLHELEQDASATRKSRH